MPICYGAGLVALDVILNGSPSTLPKFSAGGSCGNVLSILSYLGWKSYPVARLANDQAGAELLNDLSRWDIQTDFISVSPEGSTPIIIHRILKDKNGAPVHRFEFKDPDTKNWLPQFKAITKKEAAQVLESPVMPRVFYFDRINPGTLELAKHLKANGSIIFFEPSSIKDVAQFEKFLSITDILKFSNERIPDYKERYTSIQCALEIETCGKEGLNYRSCKSTKPDSWKSVKGFALQKVQDTAGAGDWCTAGVIYHLCSSHKQIQEAGCREIEKGLRFGQAMGALNCLYDGARALMYHYKAENLLSRVDKLMAGEKNAMKYLVTSPTIDISSSKKFSELYEELDF